MILSELLNVTTLDTNIRVTQSTIDMRDPTIFYFKSINDYGIVDTWDFDKCIEDFGNMTVISQGIINNTLEILIK